MNFADAVSIAYPLRDTVARDTARYLRETDNREAIRKDIERIASEYTGTVEGRNTLMSEPEVDAMMRQHVACLLTSKISSSIEHAQRELYGALVLASYRLAGADYRKKIDEAKEAAEVAAWEARQERCNEYA